MEVILLEKVVNLGDLGDKVNVKSGYARNFLVPQRKAVMATKEKIAEFETRRAELEKVAAEKLAAAQKRADALGKIEVSIAHKAGEEGKLFGSVGTVDIAEAMTAKKADGLAYNLALNVSLTLMAFSSFLALPKEQIKISGLAGLLQDVGKVKLSSDVLLKKESSHVKNMNTRKSTLMKA